jgi:serine/threonine protein kinase
MDDLIKRRDIGTGSIGTVTLYDNINSKERVVLKIIDKSSVSFEIQNYLDNELNIFEELSRYKNPNILNLKSYKITIKE